MKLRFCFAIFSALTLATSGFALPPTSRDSSAIADVRSWYFKGGEIPDKNVAAFLFAAADGSKDADLLLAAHLLGSSNVYFRPDEQWLKSSARLGNREAQSILIYHIARNKPAGEKLAWGRKMLTAIEDSQAKEGKDDPMPAMLLGALMSEEALSPHDIKFLEELGHLIYDRNAICGLAIAAAGELQEGNSGVAIDLLRQGDKQEDSSSKVALIELQLSLGDPTVLHYKDPEEIVKCLNQIAANGHGSSKVFHLLDQCYRKGLGVPQNNDRADDMRDSAIKAREFESRTFDVDSERWFHELAEMP